MTNLPSARTREPYESTVKVSRVRHRLVFGARTGRSARAEPHRSSHHDRHSQRQQGSTAMGRTHTGRPSPNTLPAVGLTKKNMDPGTPSITGARSQPARFGALRCPGASALTQPCLGHHEERRSPRGPRGPVTSVARGDPPTCGHERLVEDDCGQTGVTVAAPDDVDGAPRVSHAASPRRVKDHETAASAG